MAVNTSSVCDLEGASQRVTTGDGIYRVAGSKKWLANTLQLYQHQALIWSPLEMRFTKRAGCEATASINTIGQDRDERGRGNS